MIVRNFKVVQPQPARRPYFFRSEGILSQPDATGHGNGYRKVTFWILGCTFLDILSIHNLDLSPSTRWSSKPTYVPVSSEIFRIPTPAPQQTKR